MFRCNGRLIKDALFFGTDEQGARDYFFLCTGYSLSDRSLLMEEEGKTKLVYYGY